MVKVGKFYRVYGKDAYIIAYLFKYKISEENDIMVSGFPTSSIKKIEARLENKKIIENTTVVIPQPDSPLVQMVKQSKVTKE